MNDQFRVVRVGEGLETRWVIRGPGIDEARWSYTGVANAVAMRDVFNGILFAARREFWSGLVDAARRAGVDGGVARGAGVLEGEKSPAGGAGCH